MSLLDAAAALTPEAAEQLAGPFFGLSLLPYLAFLYFLDAKESAAPRGVVVGFAWCLVFVLLTIPAAIAAKLCYGVSLADCDWLHGSAESLLVVTNLLLVLALRDALAAEWVGFDAPKNEKSPLGALPTAVSPGLGLGRSPPPRLQTYAPWLKLGVGLSALSAFSAAVPALGSAEVHSLFLGGALNLPPGFPLPMAEPTNALSIATWVIHASSLVEWLIAMGLLWRWAEVADSPRYKGLTWGMLPLHTSGITACVYHLFYNQPGVVALLPAQAALTCVGNTCCAFAAYRIALAGGWSWEGTKAQAWQGTAVSETDAPPTGLQTMAADTELWQSPGSGVATIRVAPVAAADKARTPLAHTPGPVLLHFEDLGDSQLGFVGKLFGGCLLACYLLKYGELTQLDFFHSGSLGAAVACIAVPTLLNVLKWAKRSQDPDFDGWF